jgi:hypothetical protein
MKSHPSRGRWRDMVSFNQRHVKYLVAATCPKTQLEYWWSFVPSSQSRPLFCGDGVGYLWWMKRWCTESEKAAVNQLPTRPVRHSLINYEIEGSLLNQRYRNTGGRLCHSSQPRLCLWRRCTFDKWSNGVPSLKCLLSYTRGHVVIVRVAWGEQFDATTRRKFNDYTTINVATTR